MALFVYRNRGTKQTVYLRQPRYFGDPNWDQLEDEGGGTVSEAELDAHLDADTDVHGIADTHQLETQAGAAHKVADAIHTHNIDGDPHGDRAYGDGQQHRGEVQVVALTCAPNVTTSTTFVVTGAAVGDDVVVTPEALPVGLVLSHAYVSSANTVNVFFGNLTGSPIVLAVHLRGVTFRRT